MESLAFAIFYKTVKSHNLALKLNKESTAVHCQFKQLDQLIRKILKKEGKKKKKEGTQWVRDFFKKSISQRL